MNAVFLLASLFFSGPTCVGEIECGDQTLACYISAPNMEHCTVVPTSTMVECRAYDIQNQLIAVDTEVCHSTMGGTPIGSSGGGDDDFMHIATLDDLLCALGISCNIVI